MLLTGLVIACIFICIGVQIYYFTCWRRDVVDEEIILLD